MTLTTTQHSALVELREHGSLRPTNKAFGGPGGRRSFARRTLQALVDAGLADWRLSVRGTRNGPVTYEGFITAPRSYCVGLPVVVTVHADGRVEFGVDLSEAAEGLWEQSDYTDGETDADTAAVHAAVHAGAYTVSDDA